MRITGNLNEGGNDQGGFNVYVDGRPLSPKESQSIINHSPDGFSWGYGGSGPAQLALAILLLFCEKETATTLYQDFKWEVIAKLPPNFELTDEFINDWIHARKTN